MKLLFFDDFRLGVLQGDSVVDVSDVVKDIPNLEPQDLIRGLIERFDEYRGPLEQAAARGQGRPVEQRAHSAAAAATEQHRVHGRQLHGGRHARRAGADQRLHEVAELRSSARVTRWSCLTCRRPSSRARQKSRW